MKKFYKILITISFLLILFFVYIGLKVYGSLKESSSEAKKELPALCGGNPGSKIDFSSIRPDNKPYAEFSAAEGEVFIMVNDIGKTGALDFGNYVDIWVGAVYGLEGWDVQTGFDKIALSKLTINKGEYAKLHLVGGRFWIAPGKGANISIYSCVPNGVSDPKPVK